MAAELPSIPPEVFAARLAALSPLELPASVYAALFQHYEELRRWNPRLSLVGPGTADEVLGRHYGESLAALPLLPPGPSNVVDVGSGAGFPGLVLAAARPDLQVTLVEARGKKWAFLVAAGRRAGLSCSCLDARVARPLPAGLPDPIHLVTSRAVRLTGALLEPLVDRSPRLQLLLWCGREDPPLPSGFTPRATVELPGSERRRIVLAGRSLPPTSDPRRRLDD